MRKSITFFLTLVSLFGYSQKMVTTKVGDDISLKIPVEFITMSDQSRMRQIASSKVPLAMFSTEDQQVTLGINDNPMQWTNADTKTVYGFYKASVNALFDEIEFIQDTIKTINGREFIVFEFTSVARHDNAFGGSKTNRNYTYIQYTSYKDQVLLFNFGCRSRVKSQWEDAAAAIMQSVKVK